MFVPSSSNGTERRYSGFSPGNSHGASVPIDDDLAIVTTDWHVVSNDSEPGITGSTTPTDAAVFARYLANLRPAGLVNLGDTKDHYGTDSGDELDNYLAFHRELPYFRLRQSNASGYPILPGNHDEVNDSNVAGPNDFSLYDARLGPAPYRWSCDWPKPSIRFFGIHASINHAPTLEGLFTVTASETAWLSNQLTTLEANAKAIVCCHPPINPAFGNNVWSTTGGTELLAVLAANASKIVCVLNGHRHANYERNDLSGIPHFNLPGVAYSLGNGYGGWSPIRYNALAGTLTFDYLLGPPVITTRYAGFTPHVLTI